MDSGLQHRIRAARCFAKLKQRELAKLLDISEQTQKNSEAGKRTPKKPEREAIARATGVPEWFLEGGWENYPGATQPAVDDVPPESEADAKASAEAADSDDAIGADEPGPTEASGS